MNNEDLKKKIGDTTINVSVLRGLIITKSIDIDAYVGALITNYFVSSSKHSKFREMVLSDPYFSFGLKISILKKILNNIELKPYKGFKDDLHRIDILRNRFAHSTMFGFDGDLSYPAGEKPMKTKKAKEMYDEFMLLYPKVMEELSNLFWHIIGKPNPFKKEKKEENSVKKVG